ncbi:MAG: hypothetical protein BRC31_08800 [Actinobacteria bacterium QS_5_72_10]|nr:MAG: hypothetical protein BRC31_08800 [Actinobacteria bacterium QS_5_72_10]
MGLEAFEGEAAAVPGVDNLDAMMLDMKRTFDRVIDRHAPDRERAHHIKSNRFYQQLVSSLAGTQEYMAMEKLHELYEAGEYDCIVVDTPPTRNALDFLDAPKRLTDFLEGRFLRMLLNPGMRAGKTVGRAVGWGSGVFMRAASRVTGAGVLEDLGEFFQSFEGMYEGFKQRAQAVYKLMSSPRTSFVVIAAPEPPALQEARYFLRRLEQDGIPTAGLVVNRITAPPTGQLAELDSDAARAARAAGAARRPARPGGARAPSSSRRAARDRPAPTGGAPPAAHRGPRPAGFGGRRRGAVRLATGLRRRVRARSRAGPGGLCFRPQRAGNGGGPSGRRPSPCEALTRTPSPGEPAHAEPPWPHFPRKPARWACAA